MESSTSTFCGFYYAMYSLSQEQLLELTDCRRETIVRLEKGLYNPSLQLAYNIAKVFDVKIEDLFWFEDDDDEE